MTNSRSRMRLVLALSSAVAILLGAAASSAQDAPAKPGEVVYDRLLPGMTHPKVVHQIEPDFSGRARRKKIQGTVTMSIIVTPDGKVRDAQVVNSLDKDLDKNALDCVAKWQFEPGTKDGQPVAMRMDVQINFHLY